MLKKYPALFVLIFVAGGILAADAIRPTAWTFLLVSLIGCLAGLVCLNSQRSLLTVLAFGMSLFFFAGFHQSIRYDSPGPNHVSRFADGGQRYHLFGRVADWPDLKRERTEIKISLDSLAGDRTVPVQGNILLKVSDTTTVLQRGDRIEFFGRIYPVREQVSSGSFDYGRYLKLKEISGTVYLSTLLDVRLIKGNRHGLYRLVDDLRSAIRSSLYRNLSPTSAALAAGFLIGETRDIPPDVYRCFRDSGTLHLLAVSGSNVALVIGFCILLLRTVSISRRKRAVVLLAVILIFNLLSYGEPSVVRASIMAALVIMAGQFQRRYNLNNIIAATAVVVLLIEPAQLFDVGFQLSFLIAWSLIFGVPRLAGLFQRWHNRRWYRWVVFPLLISVIAQLGSTGLIALYFHRVPIISPLANLVVVPLVAAAVLGILALLLADLVLPLFGLMAGTLLNAELNLTLWLVQLMGGEGTPLVETPDISVGVVVLIYLFFFVGLWSVHHKMLRRVVVISGIILVNVGLLISLIQSHGGSSGPQVDLAKIPGGIAGIVQTPGDPKADLILTGLKARSYPVDDRVIGPLLKQRGIEKIESIILLSADYRALDDLLRLCADYRVDRICHARGLENSLREVTAASGRADSVLLLPFTDASAPLAGAGYYPCGGSVRLELTDATVIFTDRLQSALLKSRSECSYSTLVIGRTLNLTHGDWADLTGSGYSQIVCSRVAQFDQAPGGNESWPTGRQDQPDFLFDLSRTGCLTIGGGTAY